MPQLKQKAPLSIVLRQLVHEATAILGEVLKKQLGEKNFNHIEQLRADMTILRHSNSKKISRLLNQYMNKMSHMSSRQRLEIARAFTLMLELMNACENAYRSQELSQRIFTKPRNTPDTITYVLTAHPTEARSRQNIWIFHEILRHLTDVLGRPDPKLTRSDREKLFHDLDLAWHISTNRVRKPRVQNEAEHIYSTLLRDESLRVLLACNETLSPIFVRSWVGGDKDGHPGVDEKVFLDSLKLSRHGLVSFVRRRIYEIRTTLQQVNAQELKAPLLRLEKSLRALNLVKANDGRRVIDFKNSFNQLMKDYKKHFDIIHPSIKEINLLLGMFPALVVPLEFRESSDVLMSSETGQGLAIFRMLKTLKMVCHETDPRAYVRCFIISMASELAHIQRAAHFQKLVFHGIPLPIVPLFEQAGALQNSSLIVNDVLKDKTLSKVLKNHWGQRMEVMLGYSDSSKESGVLYSRLAIAKNMHKLDHFCRRQKITPVFFQGSGGSTDRGGGSVQDQTSWWSSGALQNYKVTIQGEMVERSMANPTITRSQLERICVCAGEWKKAQTRHLPKSVELDHFAHQVAHHYSQKIAAADFLSMVESATPYAFLNLIKIGSRPAKRTKKLSVAGLRAIPWIMCWTQTRILFPTWFGVGSAWQSLTIAQKLKISKMAKIHPAFRTYVRALGFTLAKVDLDIWRIYLEQSGLPPKKIEHFIEQFAEEFRLTKQFLKYILHTEQLIPWRPWLDESIKLRAPMIHPLNLLQVIAMKKNEADLFRVTVTGISSGMMTTG